MQRATFWREAIRYDSSDPQAGKDICDRKTAPMKAHIRRFVNENNDMTTAEDMKKALESHSGLRGCRVAVVEIDASKDLHGSNKIPDISLLYNCKYEDNGIRVWKAYNIGGGELLTNKDLPVQQQDIVRLTVKQPFGHRTKERGVIGETAISRSQTGIFPCNDSTCVLTFKTERGSEAHMD
jgi:hypothetical protein